LNRGQNLKYAPYAFTECGAVMLASVLKSRIAIEASIQVVRAFVQLRTLAALHDELAEKLEALEARYDEQFRAVFEAIRAVDTPGEHAERADRFLAPRERRTPRWRRGCQWRSEASARQAHRHVRPEWQTPRCDESGACGRRE
jgi:hypothetical protein